MYSISQCVSLVDQYADEIIQALVDGLSPDQVCTTIKLCTSVSKVSSPKVHVHVILQYFKRHYPDLYEYLIRKFAPTKIIPCIRLDMEVLRESQTAIIIIIHVCNER